LLLLLELGSDLASPLVLELASGHLWSLLELALAFVLEVLLEQESL